MNAPNRDRRPRDQETRRIVFATAVAAMVFWVVAIAVYYWLAHVAVNGFIHGGPVMLTAAMAGLFAGGLAAVVALILLMRRR